MNLFDAHLHIIEGRFPIEPNNGFLPESFTCADYLERMKDYLLVGGAIVSGSFQGFDQRYLYSALEKLGPAFVGVTQLPFNVSDQELISLNTSGVRGLRFNLKRGGSESIEHIESMARRVNELVGWHIELYVDSKELNNMQQLIATLPIVSIDHLGLSSEGFDMLLQLAEKGVRVKASGFGRCDMDVQSALRALYSTNPCSLMFGTDLPSTRAPRPYADIDYEIVIDALGESAAQRVFYDNAADFYRLNEHS